MKTNNFSATLGLIELLAKCVNGKFSENFVKDNMKLLEQIENLQCIIHDRKQLNSHNYQNRDIEDELSAVSVSVRTVIAGQLPDGIRLSVKQPLEDFFAYFEYASHINGFGPHHLWGIYQDNIDQTLYQKTKNYFAELIIESKGKPKYKEFLKKVQEHYNGADPTYKKIAKILKK